MKKALTYLAVIALIGGAIGGFIWYRNREAAQAADYDVLRSGEVVRSDLDITVAASGSVIMRRSADLVFGSPGTVRSVDVQVGDRVTAGQELARLDDTTLRDAVRRAELDLAQAELNLETLLKPVDQREIEVAQLAIREATLAMTVARSSEELAQARAAQDQARAHRLEEDTRQAYENYLRTLDEQGLPQIFAADITAAYMEAQGNVGITQVKSEYAIQQARGQWLSAHERYESAQNQVAQLRAGADEDQIRNVSLQIEQVLLTLEQAEADIESSVLVAPFDGVIAAVNVREDTATPTGMPAFVLVDDGSLYVNLTVDEIDIGRIQEGQHVEITLDAYPRQPLEGVVDRLTLLPDSLGGVVVYPIRVKITDTADTEPRDAMTASALITTGLLEDVLLIPNWAVRTDQTSVEVYTYCYCGPEGQLQQVPIEVGARNDTWTQVLSGLEEGMRVALVTEARSLFDIEGPPSRGNR
jgi:HlyD family secretion protein